MRKILIVLLSLGCLLFGTSALMAQKTKGAMTNVEVIEMVKAALSEQVIVTSIQQAVAKDFDLSPMGLIALKKAGVTDNIIQIMQQASSPATITAPNSGVKPVVADDREQTINAYFRQLVGTQSGGAISVANFQKTNGYDQDVTRLYVLEWQGDIVFEQAGYKAGDMFVGYWQDFRVLKQQPGALDSLVVGNTKFFNKGATVRIRGNSTFRKTEQGWRLEDYKVLTTQVLSAGGPVAPLAPAGATANVAGITSNSLKTESLSAAIERGEEISFKIKYYRSTWNLMKDSGLVDGIITVSRASVALQPSPESKGFSISPDKILQVINRPQLGRQVYLKIAIPNKKGDKDENKDFQFFHPATYLNGLNVTCSVECDDSMSSLATALQQVRTSGPIGDFALGRYAVKGSNNNYLEFASGGIFTLLQDGKTYNGNYNIQKDVITIQVLNADALTVRIVGNTIVEPKKKTVWEKLP